MPLYEYQCGECGYVFEKLQKRTDPAPASCPACEVEGEVERIISATNFKLKGSGWYVTDYKQSPEQESAAAAESSGASESSSDASTGADDSGTTSSSSSIDDSAA